MDRYYQSTPNKAPGFVYFNTNTSQDSHNNSDTTEFMGFSDSPQASPQPQRFQPAYSSSPQSKFHRGSPRNYPPKNRRFQRWSGGSRSFNSSNNSSYNHNNTSTQEYDQEPDISKFIHPSFLEDPWAQLETSLREKTQNSELERNDSTQSESEEN